MRGAKALLRPVFALSAVALVAFLALDDDAFFFGFGGGGGGGGGGPREGRRAMTTTTTFGWDGTVVRVEIDEHGERFAGVRYAGDDFDDPDPDRRRELDHAENHVLVELSAGRDPDVECALLAELVAGTVERVIKGMAFNGCSIVPSEMAMQNSDGTLPLEGEGAVEAVEMDGIVEAYQQDWAIWNLNRIDQCSLPLSEGPYAKEDASGVKLFVMDTGVYKDHDEFAARPGLASPIDPSDGCHFSVIESPMKPLEDGNGHG